MAFFWIQLVIIVCTFRAATSCSLDSPRPIIGQKRYCSVVNETSGFSHLRELQVAWHDDSCRNRYEEASCPGQVGMRLTLQCLPGGYVCKGRECNDSTTSSITINDLQSEHAGEYVCRTDEGVLLAFNVTVDTGVAIGMDSSFCEQKFFYSTTDQCCTISNVVEVEYSVVSRWFYVFGTNQVTVKQKWITPDKYHYHSDLGLVPGKFNSSSPYFKINITNYPMTIDKDLRVLAIITVADNFTSESVCVELLFKNYYPVIYVNQTLPVNSNTSEGNNAIFECELGSFNPESLSEKFVFQLYHHSENGNSSKLAWNRTCYPGYSIHRCGELKNDQNYQFNYTTLENVVSFISFRFTLQILKVTMESNNTFSFSCSVLSDNQIQWQHTADLIVTRPPDSDFPLGAVVASSVMVSLVIVCGFVVTVGTILARKRWSRKEVLDPDQVPLTNQTLCDSETNTPVAGTERTIATSVPTVQIVEYGNGGINGLLVRESRPVTDSDLGYQSSQSSEDLNIGGQLQTMVMNGRRTPPNTLGLTNKNGSSLSKFSKSDYDLLDDQSEVEPAIDFTCIVYISYTDKMASWVRNWLKPRIESWEHSEVMLHEDEMIPGFAICGERQRLILQAHKVVLVVSRDYSESPWCLYELQHAIQQEPALCRGRIIPILVDGCKTVPSIVKGVVPLHENDTNFDVRLRKNILGHL